MMTYALINPQSNLLLQPKPLLQWELWKLQLQLHRKFKRSATSQKTNLIALNQNRLLKLKKIQLVRTKLAEIAVQLSILMNQRKSAKNSKSTLELLMTSFKFL